MPCSQRRVDKCTTWEGGCLDGKGRCLHTIDHYSGTFYTGAKPHEDVHGSLLTLTTIFHPTSLFLTTTTPTIESSIRGIHLPTATEVIVSDPQSQLVESWMKFRNGNWSAMSPWHGPPLGTIKFRCHPHPPPSPYHRHASPHPPRHFCISGKMHQPALFRKKFHNKKLKPMLHKSNV